ncbi:Na+/H+ antiporter NhaC family protein [Clostridiales bacterium COT073_COT-073]|nr:Na+/H+ antiporter NhaC family protein [Clostridiales bacterium COT073_COT-073]
MAKPAIIEEDVVKQGIWGVTVVLLLVSVVAEAKATIKNTRYIKGVAYAVVSAIILISFAVAAKTEVTEAAFIWQGLGILTLVPPFIAIVLAFLTQNVIISLTSGILTGSMLVSLTLSKGNLVLNVSEAFNGTIKTIVNSMADPWNAGILLQVMSIGGLIALVSRMGGTHAIAEKLSEKAGGVRSSQFITWLLGLFVFFDDYANSLIVGPIMKPVTDKQRISREKLSFIIDATAAPIAGIALVSTWIGYELSLIQEELPELSFKTSAYSMFLETIPYRFYNIFVLALIVITIVLLREIGPMFQAEERARTTGQVLREGATPMAVEENMNIKPEITGETNVWNAIVPIGALIVISLLAFYFNGRSVLTGDDLAVVENAPFSLDAIRICFSNSDASIVLFMSAVLSSLLAIVMGLWQKLFTLKEAIDIWIEGWKSMIITVVILLLAWSIADIIKNQLDADQFLANSLSTTLPAFTIPTIIFVLGAAISFATGTSYGTMGILMPLAIPLANAASGGNRGLIIAAVGAVLTGAIFGDHCSPISDTTILSSMGSGADHLDHVKTQLLYALIVAGVSIAFGFLPAGLGISPWISLGSGILVIILIFRIFGKKVPNAESIEEK